MENLIYEIKKEAYQKNANRELDVNFLIEILSFYKEMNNFNIFSDVLNNGSFIDLKNDGSNIVFFPLANILFWLLFPKYGFIIPEIQTVYIIAQMEKTFGQDVSDVFLNAPNSIFVRSLVSFYFYKVKNNFLGWKVTHRKLCRVFENRKPKDLLNITILEAFRLYANNQK